MAYEFKYFTGASYFLMVAIFDIYLFLLLFDIYYIYIYKNSKANFSFTGACAPFAPIEIRHCRVESNLIHMTTSRVHADRKSSSLWSFQSVRLCLFLIN